MSSPETTNTESSNSCCCQNGEALAYSAAYLILRLWLAMRALFTGLDKFAGRKTVQVPLLDEFGQPDINGTMVAVEKKIYGLQYYQGLPAGLKGKFAAEPFLPDFLMKPYAAVLGPLLIILGIMLFLGICSRATLFVMGVLYVSLTFGFVLINQSEGITHLGVHILITVAALLLVKHDRFCLSKRW